MKKKKESIGNKKLKKWPEKNWELRTDGYIKLFDSFIIYILAKGFAKDKDSACPRCVSALFNNCHTVCHLFEAPERIERPSVRS
jgi:hypothetical protein